MLIVILIFFTTVLLLIVLATYLQMYMYMYFIAIASIFVSFFVQGMLDYDHVCSRDTPSVAAMVYPFRCIPA